MSSAEPPSASASTNRSSGESCSRAAEWRTSRRTLVFPRRPLLMGIVNVTPDSFSDGGKWFEPRSAIELGLRLEHDGADILDIGGESTRPYSSPVSAEEELRRVLPVIEALARQVKVPLSIDTSKALVARAAIDAGAEIINDVTGLTGDAAMIDVARTSKAAVSAMHMLGTPQTMQDDPRYDDVVGEVYEYLHQRRDALVAAGIERASIALDPGIGFGKTHEHNLALLAACARFHELGCPLVVGHSRKGFIGHVIADKEADRTAGTIGVSLALALAEVQVLRVHDVAAVRQALLLFEATLGSLGETAPRNS